MVMFTDEMKAEAKSIFPQWTELHTHMENGNVKIVDMIYGQIGLALDEDDIIKAFRNKKEHKILEIAKRTKAIRALYQDVLFHIDSDEMARATQGNYADCM